VAHAWWDCNLASASDRDSRLLTGQFAERMVVLTFHGRMGDSPNMKVYKRGIWNTRMLIETVLSMLTTVCHWKHQHHRQADYVRASMAFIIAACNLVMPWHSYQPNAAGMIHLSIAEFNL